MTIWTNGGPGCSSLEGLLQENGVRYFISGSARLKVDIPACCWQPFSWAWGQYKPTVNEYSWTNLSSMLYIEQPVGTGFSQGTPNIKDEDDLAAQFVGFLQQFLDVFRELKGKKAYLTGESVCSRLPCAGLRTLIIIRTLRSMPGCMFPVSRTYGLIRVRNSALTLRRYRRLYLQKEGTCRFVAAGNLDR